jgi:uncharacterized hydrophobic protein (TIGR00271 family)
MEEDIQKNIKPHPESSSEGIKNDAKGLLQKIKKFLNELFDFREDTDHEATLNAIKADIPFKGATAWILIFAVFVASIGLNADSTAVVIGAMLISPLMGPILGLGMSFALNDIETLRKSLKNLGVMIALSLLASFMFFYIFPLSEDTSELLGRTKPDIRDVLIAFFGGLALMVARTKKGTIASVIFGVAIATALMPPLCTAGYGLAEGKWWYFLGALYLFTINAIFIALATFIVLKFLRFPMHKYANAAKRKRYATIASVTGLAVMIPAVFTFIQVFQENQIEIQFNNFINTEVSSIETFQLLGEPDLDLNAKEIRLSFFNEVSDGEKNMMRNQLTNNENYYRLRDFNIRIKGSDTKSFELITTAYNEKREELKESKRIIEALQLEIEQLKQIIGELNERIENDALNRNKKAVAFNTVAKDLKIRYVEIEGVSFANVLSSKDFIKIDTIPTVTLKWNASVPDSIILSKEIELKSWLQNELKLDNLNLKRQK